MIYNVFSLLLLCCWCITEVTVYFFLINGISDLPDLLSFLSAYGLSILIVYLIVNGLIKHDNSLGKTMITEALMKFLVFLAVIPLAGPVVSLFIVLFFRLYPLYPVRVELFDRVDKDILAVLKKRYEGRAIPALEAFLLRGMNADQALRLISRIDEMEWTVMKAVILRNIIRLAFRENMVLMAIDILTKKLDQILADINTVESAENTDARTMHRLANLYHEIPYLDLCDSIMKPFYQEKACHWAVRAFEREDSEENALLSVRYLLEAGEVARARNIYKAVQEKGDCLLQMQKWIPYEFELALAHGELDPFNRIYETIETTEGVYIPDKVKEAAHTWKRVLTSAWL
ncbi:MAG: hypothetical protein K8R09_04670 [Desulfobacterales bacterium]|nr:hypothetical protein [Desulfobacterales bacterium]